MSKLTCEKIERELEINGQKAKFVASTLNLDYVIIDKTLYLGLDCYDKVIKDVRAEFASDEAIRTRAEEIIAANAAFSFVVAKEYGDCQIAVYAKENLGYVALHLCENLLYVDFINVEELTQNDINKIPHKHKELESFCKDKIKRYQEYLQYETPNRESNHAWKDNRFMQMSQEINEDDDVTVTQCEENSFYAPCLNCKKDIDYSFKPQSEPITTCPHCGAEFIVSTSIQATANYYIERVWGEK